MGCSWWQHDKSVHIHHKLEYAAQGSPHTMAAETLTKHLKEAGWETAYTYYRID